MDKECYYVYVLSSEKYNKLYIGSTTDPRERLKAHNAGRGGWSKDYRPWKRVLLEEYEDKQRALSREKYLKSGWGRRWLIKHIQEGCQSGLSGRS